MWTGGLFWGVLGRMGRVYKAKRKNDTWCATLACGTSRARYCCSCPCRRGARGRPAAASPRMPPLGCPCAATCAADTYRHLCHCQHSSPKALRHGCGAEMIRVHDRVSPVRQDRSKLQTPAVPEAWKLPGFQTSNNACSRNVPRNVPISVHVWTRTRLLYYNERYM